mgnify:CR=1 FL=1
MLTLPKNTKDRVKNEFYVNEDGMRLKWNGTRIEYYCKHNKRLRICSECGGRDICIHGKRKARCRECGGGEFCRHDIRRSRCIECGGGDLCHHGKRKQRCSKCGGSEICKSPWCDSRKQDKYQGFCYVCFVNNPEFRNHEIVRNYKNKERAVAEFVMGLDEVKDLSWIQDKTIDGGCSKRRPDLCVDMGSHIIIIEIDEHQHTDYDTTCEQMRNMNLWEDVQCRPIVFIRFNPDKYTKNGLNTPSCWKINKNGLCGLNDKMKSDWNMRLDELKKVVLFWIINEPREDQHMVTNYLFYDS